MKFSLKTLLLALCITFSLNTFAADYNPNSKWPYQFENFQQGKVFFSGNKKMDAKLNIHLWGNVLHYVGNDGRIMQCSEKDIVRVEIADDAFIFVDKKLMKIEAEEATNLVVSLCKCDFSALTSGTGAYGSSLNSSAAMDLKSLDLGGLDTPEMARMLEEKTDGRDLSTSTEYYFLIDGKAVKANKSEVMNYVGKEREADAKAFIKQNKIKWKSIDSLKQMLTFITK